MTKLLTILGAVFMIAGMLNLWGIVMRPAGFDQATIGWVDLVSLWGGLAILCVAAAFALKARRQKYYDSED